MDNGSLDRHAAGFAAGCGALVALLVAPVYATGQAGPDRAWLKEVRRTRMADDPARATEPVANLPHARGSTFTTLDAYLAYLRNHAAALDLPWYRAVSPGVYRLERGNLRTGAPPPVFTRNELERRFGFRK